MRWVKETLPPRARARWLLMTVRLSHSSLTGTERTEVAVGTVSEESMLAAVRAGAPRRTVSFGSSLTAGASGGGDSFGTGDVVPLAGSAAFASGRGVALGAGLASCFGSGAGVAWAAGAPLLFGSVLRAPLPEPASSPWLRKYSAHRSSTLL